jgi:hypothetical protein
MEWPDIEWPPPGLARIADGANAIAPAVIIAMYFLMV